MSWAHYLLQANIYLVVFYAFYTLLLDKETYFLLNRIYLLSAAVLSLCIPFIRLDWLTQQSVTQQISVSIGQLEMTVLNDPNSAQNEIPWGSLVALVYSAGLLFFIIRFCLQLYTLKNLGRTVNHGSAFSFFKRKSIHHDLPGQQVIHKHEDIHIQQLHSLDVLFFELVAILNWFNPIMYLYKTSIKHVHEYLADEKAAILQGDKEQYALLLLSTAFKVSPNALTNSFVNQSLIKKRIYMLHKQKSRKAAILKYGLYLPVFSSMLLLSSATLRQNEEIIEITNTIPLDNPMNTVASIMPGATSFNGQDNKGNLETVQANAGSKDQQEWEAFYRFITKNINYPQEAKQQKVQGNIQTKFTLENGNVKGMEALSKLGYGLDAEVMKAILNYDGFKKVANGDYVLNIAFRLVDVESSIKNDQIKPIEGYTNLSLLTVRGFANVTQNNLQGKVMDFVSVDTPPSFAGGIEEFYKFLGKTIKYPEEAKKNNIQGKVFASFVVEKDGSLKNIQILGGPGAGTNEEAFRVLNISPKWVPGKDNGQPVRVQYHIPITFTLGDKAKADVKTGDSTASHSKSASTSSLIGLKGKLSHIKIATAHINSQANRGKIKTENDLDPIYFVDGIAISNNEVPNLNSDNIERIDVVKNKVGTHEKGEIYITTKSPQAQ
jgi:TonB family protein